MERGATSPVDKNGENLPVCPPTGGSVSSVGDRNDGGGEAEVGGCTILPYLQVHGFSLRTLVAMSHGCKKVDVTVMLDITTEPFASMPAKTIKALASDNQNKRILFKCVNWLRKNI